MNITIKNKETKAERFFEGVKDIRQFNENGVDCKEVNLESGKSVIVNMNEWEIIENK